jgi:CBS domain-containing protein
MRQWIDRRLIERPRHGRGERRPVGRRQSRQERTSVDGGSSPSTPRTRRISSNNCLGVRLSDRIGAVVMLGADHRIIGILSERDIVRALAEHGPTVLNEPVSKVMTRDVKTCSENDTIDGLMARMTTGKFRHMPVVEQGKLIGIVSIGDVVKNRVEEIEHEAEALRDYVRQ